MGVDKTNLESIDRRLFLRGLMLTSSGLVVPKPTLVYVARGPTDADIQRLITECMRVAWVQSVQWSEVAAAWPTWAPGEDEL